MHSEPQGFVVFKKISMQEKAILYIFVYIHIYKFELYLHLK